MGWVAVGDEGDPHLTKRRKDLVTDGSCGAGRLRKGERDLLRGPAMQAAPGREALPPCPAPRVGAGAGLRPFLLPRGMLQEDEDHGVGSQTSPIWGWERKHTKNINNVVTC